MTPADDLAAVTAAWREAGNYQGAARLLNARGVASKTGAPWAGETVRDIIRPTLPARRLEFEPRLATNSRGRPLRHNDSTYKGRRRAVLADRPVCALGCGRPATTVDHIIPLSKGGTHALDNLRPSCWPCNDWLRRQPE